MIKESAVRGNILTDVIDVYPESFHFNFPLADIWENSARIPQKILQISNA